MPIPRTRYRCTRVARRHAVCSLEAGPPGVPLLANRTGVRGSRDISYALVLSQCAAALADLTEIAAAAWDGSLRLTLDFPPQVSEQRAGTLVSRYENNLNFMEKLFAELGTPPQTCVRVGGTVDIRDNINPQGGGEYLSDDECMVGLRAAACSRLGGRPLLMMINAGVDASTLGDMKKFDTDTNAVVVLINCGLDRLSWFAKLSFAKYIDTYVPAYYLKNVAGNGWLLKCGSEPWRVFVDAVGGVQLVSEEDARPSLVDVEAQIRLARAGIPPRKKS